jgi:hypothetical protein
MCSFNFSIKVRDPFGARKETSQAMTSEKLRWWMSCQWTNIYFDTQLPKPCILIRNLEFECIVMWLVIHIIRKATTHSIRRLQETRCSTCRTAGCRAVCTREGPLTGHFDIGYVCFSLSSSKYWYCS